MTFILLALRYWKVGLFGIALLALAVYGVHLDRQGYQRRVNEDKAQEIALLQGRIATLSLVTSMDTQVALANAKLNTKLERLAFDTPPNAGPCLDRAAASRVRSIGADQPVSTPKAPLRHSILLPKRS